MDVSHELGALRFVVDSPLSSKVAMFNQQVNQHKQSQLLNPFTQPDGRSSPKPTFSKDEYGKPLAGSLTEMRGQKANIHVLKEMLELCQIIDSEGYNVKDEPAMRVIPFGELFNIYNYISDKVVGILLRARKHKLVEFEGEMLFQRRDDDVPVFLMKPIQEIRRELEDKIEGIKRSGSSSPQATSVLLDKKANGLSVPRGASPRSSISRTPSPQSSKAGTPTRETKAKPATAPAPAAVADAPKTEEAEVVVVENKPTEVPTAAATEASAQQAPQTTEVQEETKPTKVVAQEQQPLAPVEVQVNTDATPAAVSAIKTDVNNNSNNNELPTIVIEASAVYEGPATTNETSETVVDTETVATPETATTTTNTISDSEPNSAVPSDAPAETAASV